MGWLDNLDNELKQNEKPGPSGIERTPVIEMRTFSKKEKNITNPQNIDQEKIFSAYYNAKKSTNPYGIFAEKVAIAGLFEACNAKIFGDRCMFRLALVLAFSVIVWQTIKIINQYRNPKTVFVDLPSERQTPFPNITICFSSSLNESVVWQYLTVPEKAQLLLDEHNITLDAVVKSIKLGMHSPVKAATMYPKGYKINKLITEATMEAAKAAGENFVYRINTPECGSVFSNCALSGQKFDCCEYTRNLFAYGFSCMEIQVKITKNFCFIPA
jgi:hypothetical protein